MSDYAINIEYKDKSLKTVQQKTYSLQDYTALIKQGLLKVIADVEDAFYYLEDNKSKSDWDDVTTSMFQKIRHKLLDEANAVCRIPDNIVDREKISQDKIQSIIDALSKNL